MKKLNFNIKINAKPEKVWNALWSDENYREWTSVFSEGSYAESDWKEGSRIKFLSSDGGGMYSTIASLKPNQYMSFKHIGEIKDGKEMPLDEKSQSWTGSVENYTLKEVEGGTDLMVDMDIVESHYDYFNEAFPKSLQKVKEIAER